MLGGALGCNIGKLPLQGINLRPQRRFPFLHRGLSRGALGVLLRCKLRLLPLQRGFRFTALLLELLAERPIVFRAKPRLQGPPRLLRSRLFITKSFFPPGGLGRQKILRLRFHPPEHIFLETLQISGRLRTFRKKPFLEFLLELPAESFPGPDLLLQLSPQPGDFVPGLLEFRGRDRRRTERDLQRVVQNVEPRSAAAGDGATGFGDGVTAFGAGAADGAGWLLARSSASLRCATSSFFRISSCAVRAASSGLAGCEAAGGVRQRGRLAGRWSDIQLLNIALGYRVLDPLFICLGIGILRICLHRHLDQPRGTLKVASFEELVGHLQEIAGLFAPFLLLCVVSFSHREESSSSLFPYLVTARRNSSSVRRLKRSISTMRTRSYRRSIAWVRLTIASFLSRWRA